MIVIATQVRNWSNLCEMVTHIWSRLMTQARLNCTVVGRSVQLSACRAPASPSLCISEASSFSSSTRQTHDSNLFYPALSCEKPLFLVSRLFNWEQMFSPPWEMIRSLVTEGGGPCFITHIKSLLNDSIQRKYRPIFILSIWGQVV